MLCGKVIAIYQFKQYFKTYSLLKLIRVEYTFHSMCDCSNTFCLGSSPIFWKKKCCLISKLKCHRLIPMLLEKRLKRNDFSPQKFFHLPIKK